MHIAVVADSHGGKMHLERFISYCERTQVEHVFHLGDVAEDGRFLKKRLDIPVTLIKGNCDLYSSEPREQRITLMDKRILLVHGDVQGVKYGLDRLSYYAEENQMDVAFFGHTHRAYVGYVGGVLLINPGALKIGSMCDVEVSREDIVPRILDIDLWHNENVIGG